jgi:putative transposase
MGMSNKHSLAHLTQAERAEVEKRLDVLRPFLEGQEKQRSIVKTSGISQRTITRWLEAYRLYGPEGLLFRKRADRGQHRVLNGEQQEYIAKQAQTTPQISVKSIYTGVVALAVEKGIKPPSYRTVALFLQQHHDEEPRKKSMAMQQHYDEQQWTKSSAPRYDLSKYWLYIPTMQDKAIFPNDVWHIKSRVLDIRIFNGRGRLARACLTLVIDMYSGMIAGYYVSVQHPDITHTALALRQAILPKVDSRWHICGVPKKLNMDDPRTAKIRNIAHVCDALQISLVTATLPLQHTQFDQFFYTMDQYFEQFSPQTLAPKFHKYFHDFVMDHYHMQPSQQGTESPLERWLAGDRQQRFPEDVTQLDALLITLAKEARVHKNGIHFRGKRYFHPNLLEHIGEMLMIRYDPRDLSEIRLYQHNTLICCATRMSKECQ